MRMGLGMGLRLKLRMRMKRRMMMDLKRRTKMRGVVMTMGFIDEEKTDTTEQVGDGGVEPGGGIATVVARARARAMAGMDPRDTSGSKAQ